MPSPQGLYATRPDHAGLGHRQDVESAVVKYA